ncbi:MAG: VOC family protein, partial [Solirubrobacteraceae bacterium]
MIELRRIDHVCLRVSDVDQAAARWAAQFGLHVRERSVGRAALACDDEPYCLELIPGEPAGLDHVAYELARACSVEQA